MDAYSAFGLSQTDLAALGPNGAGADTFGALQRPWRWSETGPILSPRAARLLPPEAYALPPFEAFPSSDGSTKLLFTFGTGRVGTEGVRTEHVRTDAVGTDTSRIDTVEAVHMPRRDRVTLCISSQVGCAIGCGFCATASMGFRRHLSAGEIVAQVLTAVHALGPRHPGHITIVFMGMGEPLHNLNNVLKAVEILCDARGLGMSPRRITVSTSGLVPQMNRLARSEVRPLLALSLNATTDELRSKLMPIGERYPLAELQTTLQQFPLRPRERILLEYVLLDGVNDSDDDARRLAAFGEHFPHHINVIPYNAHTLSSFRAPAPERVVAFTQAVLAHRPTLEHGPGVVTVRHSRARDVQGACGQLVVLRRGEPRANRRGVLGSVDPAHIPP